MSSTTARAGVAGLALALTTSLSLMAASIAGEELPQSSLTAADVVACPPDSLPSSG